MTPTSTSIAPGARAGTAVPSHLPAVGRAGSNLLDRAGDPAYRRLAEAPIGEYGVLEAAVAWHRLRPAGAEPVEPAPTFLHLPIAETLSEAVAARVARLLSGLTWAIVTRVGDADAGGPQPAVLRVAVPKIHYHRVLRALTAAWRTTKRQCRPGEPSGLADDAAVALWRMGLLTTGSGHRPDVVLLRTGTAAEAGMFAAAARRLGLAPAVEYLDGGPVVALCDPDDVRRLYDQAGASPGDEWLRGPGRGDRGRLPAPDRVLSSARRH